MYPIIAISLGINALLAIGTSPRSSLSVTPSAVSQWLRRASIPAEKAIEIEIITKGKFKAVDLI